LAGRSDQGPKAEQVDLCFEERVSREDRDSI